MWPVYLKAAWNCRMMRTFFKQAMRDASTICPAPCDIDLSSFDLESGVQVTCDVGYVCANCSLPRPLCSLIRLDVRDRQTDPRQHHPLMPPLMGRDKIEDNMFNTTSPRPDQEHSTDWLLVWTKRCITSDLITANAFRFAIRIDSPIHFKEIDRIDSFL